MSADETISFSFCQVSDLNLDTSLALNLHLSPAQRKQRNEESIEALADTMKMASSDDVNAVLIPGNLFDAENITTQAVARVQRIFAMLEQIPVFIAPGALDPLFSDSLYDESALRAHGLEPWSENVHIFASNRIHTFTLPGRSSVRISGIGLSKETRRNTPQLKELSDSNKAAINILLLPLGLVDTKTGRLEGELAERIKNLGYSYIALSGFKNAVDLNSGENTVIAAAAGTFFGQTERELGPRRALFGNLDRHMSSGIEMSIREEEFDPRRIVKCDFDVTGKAPDDLKDLLAISIEESGARPGKDIMVLHLNGTYPAGCELDLAGEVARQDFFHIKMINNTRPDYLETLSDKNLIETRFVEIISELKANAEPPGSSKAKTIDDALYYGLEAIREGRVTIRHVD